MKLNESLGVANLGLNVNPFEQRRLEQDDRQHPPS